MTSTPLPLSRPVNVTNLPPKGLDVPVETTPDERAALAKILGLPDIQTFSGVFRVKGTASNVQVTGEVRAQVVYECVVTLDHFEASIQEAVDVTFEEETEAASRARSENEADAELEENDPIINGMIDVGMLAAEFLALGLDPYPRKPGAVFVSPLPDSKEEHPFAALAQLKEPKDQ